MLYSLLNKGALSMGNWSVFQKATGLGKNSTFETTITWLTEKLHRYSLLQHVHHVGMQYVSFLSVFIHDRTEETVGLGFYNI